jgi:epoxyqueuosine reductase
VISQESEITSTRGVSQREAGAVLSAIGWFGMTVVLALGPAFRRAAVGWLRSPFGSLRAPRTRRHRPFTARGRVAGGATLQAGCEDPGVDREWSEHVRRAGRALGFDAVGIAPAEPPPHAGFLREWLGRGYAGEMAWIGRRAAEREDPRRVLPGARSVVMVAVVYDSPAQPEEHAARIRERAASSPVAASKAEASKGLVARYAGGRDYHHVLLERLAALEREVGALAPGAKTRRYVDTGPLLERPLAARAGLGWVGKNTLLIHPALGSYLFLGAVLTDLALAPDEPEPDHCGSCRACLDACPTDAFPEPYVLDASRCLSYTTIELRGEIPEPLRAAQADWVFGCDVCQEVCPWNLRSKRRVPADAGGLRAALAAQPAWRGPALAWLLELGPGDFDRAAAGTALTRTKWRGLLRNALVAAGNSGDASLLPLLRRHAAGEDALLAEHARWAIERIEPA